MENAAIKKRRVRGPASKYKLKEGACKEFLREEVSSILRESVANLRERIVKGDVAALKALWQMSGLDQEKPRPHARRDKTAARILKRLRDFDSGRPEEMKG